MDFESELHGWQELDLAGGETVAGKIAIVAEFPDPEHLLDTAYDFLRRLKAPAMTVITQSAATSCFEEYVIATEPGRCLISAGDTEGIRRGIYKVGELLREYEPSELPRREERFTPNLKIRISRFRFGAEYELNEGVDYYPDGFLDRFASEGVNATWFNMLPLAKFTLTPWHPNDPEEKQRLQAKLARNVQQCRRYGIRVFPYIVIPAAWNFYDPLLERYPDLAGPALYGRKCFCMKETGRRYLYDAFNQLFSAVPDLGGMLLIVQGEGAAICPGLRNKGATPCQEKCGMSAGEVFAAEFKAILDGIRDAAPKADLIAWYYLPFEKSLEPYHEEALAKAPKGIIFQCNAESGGCPVQLGKKRPIGDYWQCITTPSPVYQDFAALTKKYGHRLSGKIQVGTSHEVGSIPYVPVPLLTYRKYRGLWELGTTDVMQVWGTGGTPGMMNFAAGRLAFTDFNRVSEEEFLLSLARTLWGKKNADTVARGWRLLSEAYTNYPYSNMVQYFGPVADGVNWPLCPIPEETPLMPTWSLNKGVISGDNVCECFNNHSHEELVTLFQTLSEQWNQGVEVFRQLANTQQLTATQTREIIRMEALGIQFATSYRIFYFYLLRRKLFAGDGDRVTLLDEMAALVRSELAARKQMVDLVRKEPVLGYNPEACGHKYNETTIKKSLPGLEATLEVLQNWKNGAPLPTLNTPPSYPMDGTTVTLEHLEWSGRCDGDELRFLVRCPKVFTVMDEVGFAFDDGGVSFPLHGHLDHTGRVFIAPPGVTCHIQQEEGGWRVELVVPRSSLPGQGKNPVRFNVVRLMDSYDNRCSWPGLPKQFLTARLCLAFYNPADMGGLDI